MKFLEASNIVKPIKVLLSVVLAVTMLLAFTVSVPALGFDAEEAYQSVFVIYSGNSLGSGFAVGENCIITNAHVVGNRRHITVVTHDGTEYRATLVGMDERQDIAVLAVDAVTFTQLPLADVAAMKLGDDICAIGAPKGMEYTLTKGIVSAKEREVNGQTYIQHDAPINEGNSGGPLLTDDGAVLGVNTLKMTDSEGLGLAIPITRVCAYLESLGVALDEDGNVKGRLEAETLNPTTTAPTEGSPEDDSDQKDNKNGATRPGKTIPPITYVAVAVAVLSLFGNLLLIVWIIQLKKQKNGAPHAVVPPTQPIDPRERTDFEIEFLE